MKLLRSPLAPPLAFCALLGISWLAQPQETHAVRGGVSYISNKGGNIGVLVNAAGSLMVDAQFADVAPENEAAVVALGRRRAWST